MAQLIAKIARVGKERGGVLPSYLNRDTEYEIELLADKFQGTALGRAFSIPSIKVSCALELECVHLRNGEWEIYEKE